MKIIARVKEDLFKDVRKEYLERWDDNTISANIGYCINDYSYLSDGEMLKLTKLGLAKVLHSS